ncbi:hypothetical protein AB0M44_22560 [Streptosporangium subroseum]|uniref:hypothetical protein n=1 Tax=Streptosporangium subroseum TaxID=106412 RepID=UPI0034450943
MTSAQTAAQLDLDHLADPVTDATAEKRDQTLAVVQRLLTARGVRSYVVHTVELTLFGDGKPYPPVQRDRNAPELTVHSAAGRVVATVIMGPRSGYYLVSLRNGAELQAVRREHPEKAANLICAAQPGDRT